MLCVVWWPTVLLKTTARTNPWGGLVVASPYTFPCGQQPIRTQLYYKRNTAMAEDNESSALLILLTARSNILSIQNDLNDNQNQCESCGFQKYENWDEYKVSKSIDQIVNRINRLIESIKSKGILQ
jgi:hypothetical protein